MVTKGVRSSWEASAAKRRMRFGSGAGSKGSLDVGKHGIKGTAQAANLGVGGIVHFHAAGQVTGRDGRSCLFHLGEGGRKERATVQVAMKNANTSVNRPTLQLPGQRAPSLCPRE